MIRRNANIMQVVNKTNHPDSDDSANGKGMVTFGEYKNDPAKFHRTDSLEIKLSASYFDAQWSTLQETFAVISSSGTPPLQYSLQLDDSGIIGTPGNKASDVNMYVTVIEGDGSGQIRKVNATATSPTADVMNIAIADYFETPLATSGDDQSWVKLTIVARAYESDHWPCKDFIESDGDVLDKGVELHSYDEDAGFTELPRYGYDVTTDDSDKNRIEIDPKLFGSDIDTLDSFLVLPVTNAYLYSEADLTKWNEPTYFLTPGYDGVYRTNPSQGNPSYSIISGSFEDTRDKDSTTFLHFRIQSPFNPYIVSQQVKFVIEFTLPPIPDTVDIDSAYVGIKASCDTDDVQLHTRRIVGNPVDIITAASSPNLLHDLPDFYYDDSVSTNNRDFYTSDEYLNGDSLNVKPGYINYQLEYKDTESVDGKDLYNTIHKAALIVTFNAFPSQEINVNLRLYELAIILKKSVSIKKEIFSPFQGRIINSTWGSRKTAGDIIESPIDALEHIRRLGNWSEVQEFASSSSSCSSSSSSCSSSSSSG